MSKKVVVKTNTSSNNTSPNNTSSNSTSPNNTSSTSTSPNSTSSTNTSSNSTSSTSNNSLNSEYVLVNNIQNFNDVYPSNYIKKDIPNLLNLQKVITNNMCQIFNKILYFLPDKYSNLVYNKFEIKFEKDIIFNSDYEYNHTIYLNYPKGAFFESQNKNLGLNIIAFFKSRYRIFVGFIKINGSILSKTFLGVEGHLNSFIIDKKKQLIIHFEPKGKQYLLNLLNLDTTEIIKYLNNSIDDTNTKETLETFTFLTTITSNFIAPQINLKDIFLK